jgi:hypothetical protein
VGAFELIGNGYPPLAQITAAAEGVCVLVTDLEERYFFFGCETSVLPRCVTIKLIVGIAAALRASVSG